MFLATTPQELKKLNIKQLDVIIVSGDTYIDSPYIGAAIIGRVLDQAGFSVGIIAQPDIKGPEDITRLGEPRLFWGISGGSVDSMVANYTALKKFRNQDDLTPGEINNRRPDRAVIVYSNLIRQYFKNTAPLVLGGVEASLRRIAHYDFWDNKVRNPVLFDAKADYLVYGMGEKTVLALAQALRAGKSLKEIRGLCYIDKCVPKDFLVLPSCEECKSDKNSFIKAFSCFYENQDPRDSKGMVQALGQRFLIHNPPEAYESQAELDKFYDLKFTGHVHPFYQTKGKVRAMDTIGSSITTHRGCYGECRFCSIAVHQGREIRWRSEDSILNEAQRISARPEFKGHINDLGGPTANMYGFDCSKKKAKGACKHKSCLFPEVCPSLKPNHKIQIQLLRKVQDIKAVKKVFIASGIRYDLILEDNNQGETYLKVLLKHHTSGQLKLAPEHSEPKILTSMGKPLISVLNRFLKLFYKHNSQTQNRKYLTYYFIAAYPGCTESEMVKLKQYTRKNLNIRPQQVQIFTPTPSTWASLMYYTQIDPVSGEKLFVEKNHHKKQKQKDILFEQNSKKQKDRSSHGPKKKKQNKFK